MASNESDKYLFLNQFGEVVESPNNSHPEAVMLLAAPGGQITADLVTKHNLHDRIRAADPDAVKFDPAGNAIVIEDGRAHAVATLAEDDPRRIKGQEAEVQRKKEKAASTASGKSALALSGQIVAPLKGAVPAAAPGTIPPANQAAPAVAGAPK